MKEIQEFFASNWQVLGGSSVVVTLINVIYNFITSQKKEKLEYITDERSLWRKEIREIAEDIGKNIGKEDGKGENMSQTLAKLKVRLNSEGINYDNPKSGLYYTKDGHIWNLLKEFKATSEEKEKLIYYLSALLKFDWERSKIEVIGSINSGIIHWILLMLSVYGIVNLNIKAISGYIMVDVLLLIVAVTVLISNKPHKDMVGLMPSLEMPKLSEALEVVSVIAFFSMNYLYPLYSIVRWMLYLDNGFIQGDRQTWELVLGFLVISFIVCKVMMKVGIKGDKKWKNNLKKGVQLLLVLFLGFCVGIVWHFFNSGEVKIDVSKWLVLLTSLLILASFFAIIEMALFMKNYYMYRDYIFTCMKISVTDNVKEEGFYKKITNRFATSKHNDDIAYGESSTEKTKKYKIIKKENQ